MSKIISKIYSIKSLLGTGGMSKVYLAQDTRTGKKVAIKVLNESLSSDPEYIRRFKREIEISKTLGHHNIVKIISYGKDKDRYYIVYEYIDGVTLDKYIKSKKLFIKEIEDITLQIIQGLSYAHSKGVIHRDIKPSNIMIAKDGSVKILDFGIARATTRSTITKTGMFMGSPHYTSPEQIEGKKIDARTDIYSLGIVLYEITEGRVPFRADTPLGFVRAHLDKPVPKIKRQIPSYLKDIIYKSLEKNPCDRFYNVEDISTAIKSGSNIDKTVVRAIVPEINETIDATKLKKKPFTKQRKGLSIPIKFSIAVGGILFLLVAIIITIATISLFTDYSKVSPALNEDSIEESDIEYEKFVSFIDSSNINCRGYLKEKLKGIFVKLESTERENLYAIVNNHDTLQELDDLYKWQEGWIEPLIEEGYNPDELIFIVKTVKSFSTDDTLRSHFLSYLTKRSQETYIDSLSMEDVAKIYKSIYIRGSKLFNLDNIFREIKEMPIVVSLMDDDFIWENDYFVSIINSGRTEAEIESIVINYHTFEKEDFFRGLFLKYILEREIDKYLIALFSMDEISELFKELSRRGYSEEDLCTLLDIIRLKNYDYNYVINNLDNLSSDIQLITINTEETQNDTSKITEKEGAIIETKDSSAENLESTDNIFNEVHESNFNGSIFKFRYFCHYPYNEQTGYATEKPLPDNSNNISITELDGLGIRFSFYELPLKSKIQTIIYLNEKKIYEPPAVYNDFAKTSESTASTSILGPGKYTFIVYCNNNPMISASITLVP